MYIAAAMISMRFEVSEPIRVENCIGSTWTSKPASLPISVMRSTIRPWMVLVWVSRKVKGTPVGVEPTFMTCCAIAGADRVAASAASTPQNSFEIELIVSPPGDVRMRRNDCTGKPSAARLFRAKSDVGARGLAHLHPPAPAREGKAHEPVDRAGKSVGLHAFPDPGGVGERGLGDAEKVEDRDDEDKRGVLDERDELVRHRGQSDAQRLRQHDERGR